MKSEEYTPEQRAYLAALNAHCQTMAEGVTCLLSEEYGVTITPEAEQHIARLLSLHVPEGTNLMLRHAGLLTNTQASDSRQ